MAREAALYNDEIDSMILNATGPNDETWTRNVSNAEVCAVFPGIEAACSAESRRGCGQIFADIAHPSGCLASIKFALVGSGFTIGLCHGTALTIGAIVSACMADSVAPVLFYQYNPDDGRAWVYAFDLGDVLRGFYGTVGFSEGWGDWPVQHAMAVDLFNTLCPGFLAENGPIHERGARAVSIGMDVQGDLCYPVLRVHVKSAGVRCMSLPNGLMLPSGRTGPNGLESWLGKVIPPIVVTPAGQLAEAYKIGEARYEPNGLIRGPKGEQSISPVEHRILTCLCRAGGIAERAAVLEASGAKNEASMRVPLCHLRATLRDVGAGLVDPIVAGRACGRGDSLESGSLTLGRFKVLHSG